MCIIRRVRGKRRGALCCFFVTGDSPLRCHLLHHHYHGITHVKCATHSNNYESCHFSKHLHPLSSLLCSALLSLLPCSEERVSVTTEIMDMLKYHRGNITTAGNGEAVRGDTVHHMLPVPENHLSAALRKITDCSLG